MDGLWGMKLKLKMWWNIAHWNQCRVLPPDSAGLGGRRRQVPPWACPYPGTALLGGSWFPWLQTVVTLLKSACRYWGSVSKFWSLPSVYSKKRCVCKAGPIYITVIQISISSVASHPVFLPPGTRYPHPSKIWSCSLLDKF